MDLNQIKNKAILYAKRILGIPSYDGLSYENYIKYKRLRIGKKKFKQKYTATDIVKIMEELGMRKGSNVFIHSSWNEFYNYLGNEIELIEKILNVIGSEGTLIMPAYPFVRKNKIFDVRRTVTKAGMLAEEFRKYPGVKRSINVRHSVCAIGPKADFLLTEHHLGDNCWDEKSPYYKLAEINALIFAIGLNKRFVGTILHCVEGVLWKELPYFRDMFFTQKSEFKYIDYDGIEKSYFSYNDKQKRIFGSIKARRYIDKYIKYTHKKISNLDITVYDASQILPAILQNGRKGIVAYSHPSTRGYKFNK